MMWWLAGGLLTAVVAVHMARPRGERRLISSARFFDKVPQPPTSKSRLRLANPLLSLPFYVRLTVLLLFIAALLAGDHTINAWKSRSLHLLVLVDCSASMGTIYDGQTAMALVKPRLQAALARIALLQDLDVSLQVATFDTRVRPLLKNAVDLNAAFQVVDQLEPGYLATDLGVVRTRLQQAGAPDSKTTHVLVLTDQPPPEWLQALERPVVVWLDVAHEVANSGITRIEPVRNPLTGMVAAVRLEFTFYGETPIPSQIEIRDAGGASVLNQPVAWQKNRRAYLDFVPKGWGRHTISLSPGGAYGLDDQAVIDIPPAEDLRVDWRARPNPLMTQTGWGPKPNPHLRVTNNLKEIHAATPTLVLAQNGPASGEQLALWDFLEDHPLLRDLNFDALAETDMTGQRLSEDWTTVLKDSGGALVAVHQSLPAVWLPEPKQGTQLAVYYTLFFNAVRYLLQERPLVPLYRLTDEAHPLPEGNRLALHPGEGDTWRMPLSSGSMDDVVFQESEPGYLLFPLLLLALTLMIFERRQSASGEGRWH